MWQTEDVAEFDIPRPFGRSCSALRSPLRESLQAAERNREVTRLDYLDALHRGLAAVRDDDDRSSPDVGSTLGMLERTFRVVDEGLALLKPEQDEDMQIADL